MLPPYVGALYTPGWWGWGGGGYFWHGGYWGREVGYYGGINYGFGYFGVGFYGGYWNGGHFWYNRAYGHFGEGFHGAFYNRTYAGFNGRPGGVALQLAPARAVRRPTMARSTTARRSTVRGSETFGHEGAAQHTSFENHSGGYAQRGTPQSYSGSRGSYTAPMRTGGGESHYSGGNAGRWSLDAGSGSQPQRAQRRRYFPRWRQQSSSLTQPRANGLRRNPQPVFFVHHA